MREGLAGLWGAFAHAFSRIRAILEPVAKSLGSAFGSLFKAIFSVGEILGITANATDGSGWRKFGAVIGTVAGVLMQGLAYALETRSSVSTVPERAP